VFAMIGPTPVTPNAPNGVLIQGRKLAPMVTRPASSNSACGAPWYGQRLRVRPPAVRVVRSAIA
jgi:hypothetical protein